MTSKRSVSELTPGALRVQGPRGSRGQGPVALRVQWLQASSGSEGPVALGSSGSRGPVAPGVQWLQASSGSRGPVALGL